MLSVDQIKAIAEMKISRDIAMTILQEKGITTGGPRQGDDNSAQGTAPADGQKPADGQQPPADGKPAQASGGDSSSSQSADGQTASNGQPPAGGKGPGGGMIQPGLIECCDQNSGKPERTQIHQ